MQAPAGITNAPAGNTPTPSDLATPLAGAPPAETALQVTLPVVPPATDPPVTPPVASPAQAPVAATTATDNETDDGTIGCKPGSGKPGDGQSKGAAAACSRVLINLFPWLVPRTAPIDPYTGQPMQSTPVPGDIPGLSLPSNDQLFSYAPPPVKFIVTGINGVLSYAGLPTIPTGTPPSTGTPLPAQPPITTPVTPPLGPDNTGGDQIPAKQPINTATPAPEARNWWEFWLPRPATPPDGPGIVMSVPAQDRQAIDNALTGVMGGPPIVTDTKGPNQFSFYPNGTRADADRVFDSMPLKNVQPTFSGYGEGRTGTLPDGTQVTVRPSQDGRPTIQVFDTNRPNGNTRSVQEIRFGTK